MVGKAISYPKEALGPLSQNMFPNFFKQIPDIFLFFCQKVLQESKAVPWCVRVFRGYPLAAWRREARFGCWLFWWLVILLLDKPSWLGMIWRWLVILPLWIKHHNLGWVCLFFAGVSKSKLLKHIETYWNILKPMFDDFYDGFNMIAILYFFLLIASYLSNRTSR